ncbi:putative origin recognition complex subunit 1 protein [Eutypa lata UCREL1]|uniref:Origin recognition complex subunit 1 n=1 Tax=Eutypa lata (strain UCR-EL1) TaxID=1287681 RepID=M7TGX0_EUTLA|nr:putative origin recognition complex subunit 1 protein [Eutypa lata UCREL1]
MAPRKKSSRRLMGVARDDSDDELGADDHPWEWVYASSGPSQSPSTAAGPGLESGRKRKREDVPQEIVGARMGKLECRVGDCVLLKAEGSNEPWVAIIEEFIESDEDGDKAAKFLWFSTEKELRNRERKRTDYLWNELYITAASDINPVASINDHAIVLSANKFARDYPTGKAPRNAQGCNKTFGREGDIADLVEFVKKGTQSTRRRPKRDDNPNMDSAYIAGRRDPDEDGNFSDDAIRKVTVTPKKKQKTTRVVTPSSRRAQLHVASVPSSLPCRESEFSLVYSHLEAAITDGSGACIYISGTPGTGKTATVREVVSKLDDAVRSDELDDFIFVEINGMKITDPYQSYSLLWEALKDQRVSPSQALDLLEREFNNPSPRRVPCVVLMDELDQLVTKNQSVMYNFFNWPGLRHSRLIVLAVANTMDLPERTLSNKISSRLGLTRITFPGYNHEQLMKIIQSRLQGVPGNIVEPDAVQFASRKVAAVSGDARRALDICRRAVELAEAEAKGVGPDPGTPSKRAKAKTGEADKTKSSRGRVTIATVKRAINEATTSPLQQYLRALPFASKLVLTALLIRNERTGLPDTTYGDMMEEMSRALVIDAGSRRVGLLRGWAARDSQGNDDNSLVRRRDTRSARIPGIGAAAVDLTGAGIIFLEGLRAERPSKIRLAVGDEEVKLAFRDDPEIKALGIAF